LDELWRLDATDLAVLIRSGAVSAVEAARSALERLDAVNPALNAVVRVLADEALEQAQEADAAQRRGDPLGLLHGVPVTTKITADHRGCPTDNGLVSMKDHRAAEDSAVVANLRRAGAVFLGRTASPAFAMRGMTSSVLHGQTWNPWSRAVTCGGSSGGAGAAVAAGIGAIAHGSDIGGSIRWPAYCNGVVGLRTSLGRIPSHNPSGTNGRALSGQIMAVQGPLARSVRDARLALEAMSPGDPRDGWWTPAPLRGPPVARRAAILPLPAGLKVDPRVSDAVRTAGRHLQSAGFEVVEAEPPHLVETTDLWHPIGLPTLASGLAPMLDQVGDPPLTNFITHWLAEKGVPDLAGHVEALRRRDQIHTAWNQFFERYPVLVTPISSTAFLPAERDGEGVDGALEVLEALRLQFMCPVLGLPGLSVPVGECEGRPLGVQIIAARHREDLCLEAGEIIETHERIRTPIDPRP